MLFVFLKNMINEYTNAHITFPFPSQTATGKYQKQVHSSLIMETLMYSTIKCKTYTKLNQHCSSKPYDTISSLKNYDLQ